MLDISRIDDLSVDHDGLGYRGCSVAGLRERVPEAVVLAAVQARLHVAIDAAAEDIRLRFITPGAGQALEYAEAQTQAAAALVDVAPTPERYPMLAASIGIDIDPETGGPATDVAGVARSVDAARLAWQSAGAAIRRARLAAKRAVTLAPTVDAAAAAYSGAEWPAL